MSLAPYETRQQFTIAVESKLLAEPAALFALSAQNDVSISTFKSPSARGIKKT